MGFLSKNTLSIDTRELQSGLLKILSLSKKSIRKERYNKELMEEIVEICREVLWKVNEFQEDNEIKMVQREDDIVL